MQIHYWRQVICKLISTFRNSTPLNYAKETPRRLSSMWTEWCPDKTCMCDVYVWCVLCVYGECVMCVLSVWCVCDVYLWCVLCMYDACVMCMCDMSVLWVCDMSVLCVWCVYDACVMCVCDVYVCVTCVWCACVRWVCYACMMSVWCVCDLSAVNNKLLILIHNKWIWMNILRNRIQQEALYWVCPEKKLRFFFFFF